MSKKPISQKHADREKQENSTLSRVYYVFLLGLAAECWLFLVYRGYAFGTPRSMLAWHNVLVAATWVGLAALVIGAVAGFLKRQDRKMRTIMSWAAGAGAFFLVSSWVVTHFFSNGTGVIAMCILVPIVVVLALVYLLYQHECALSTVMLSGAMFSVWLRSASANSSIWRLPVMIGCIAAAAVVVAVLFLVFRVQKDGGKVLGGQVFSSECDYRVLYGVLGIAAAALLLAAAVSVTAYYLLWALAVLLFAELVFYTTKLM